MGKTKILSETQIAQKLKRMAYEIVERNLHEKSIIIAGISGNGFQIAVRLNEEVKKVNQIDTRIIEISLDKEAPTQGEIKLSDNQSLNNMVVILVDDVLNTGRTMAYSLKPFLSSEVKKIETAVLVNRSHTTFPIAPTYTGYELSTTLTDHVEVHLTKNKEVVYLV
jgi:pyrimidine operon attenuation protein/uracil phosphoribosyltransferase